MINFVTGVIVELGILIIFIGRVIIDFIYGGTISATSIYMMYEYPELIKRGIEIIQQLIGG